MDIMVSVICATYNHEKFIAKAIDGFLMQKTNFKYEVVIHDDASTDRTVEIIKEYQKKYPDIIKPIFEEENQYSKGVSVTKITSLQANGKYVAICEGDDYWTDPNKLQMQVDFLENNSDYSYTFHNACIVWEDGSMYKEYFLPVSAPLKAMAWENKSRTYSVNDIIELGFIPAASVVTYKKHLDNREFFCENPVCGDLPLRLYMALQGKAYYINKVMSAYRTGNPRSASGMASKDDLAAFKTLEGHIDILNGFNKYSNYKYNDAVQHNIARRKLLQYIRYPESEYSDKNMIKILWKETELSFCILFILKTKYRPLYDFLRGIYHKFKKEKV